MSAQATTMTKAATPAGVQHLVLNVRDLEASHEFWTGIMGFTQTAELENNPGMQMRFYRGANPEHHHDLALAQVRGEAAPEPDSWSMAAKRPGLNHMAVQYPTREAWLQQIEHLQANGVTFHVRGEHGMAHSAYVSDPDGHGIEVLYELPRETWEKDISGALNYFKPLPREGAEALEDSTDYKRFD